MLKVTNLLSSRHSSKRKDEAAMAHMTEREKAGRSKKIRT